MENKNVDWDRIYSTIETVFGKTCYGSKFVGPCKILPNGRGPSTEPKRAIDTLPKEFAYKLFELIQNCPHSYEELIYFTRDSRVPRP